MLVGVSGQSGVFNEEIVKEMAKHVQHPIIFSLSNPTSCVEAQPKSIVEWTEGRAIVGTGSPFTPFEYRGKKHAFAQSNNSYIFPGVGLATLETAVEMNHAGTSGSLVQIGYNSCRKAE